MGLLFNQTKPHQTLTQEQEDAIQEMKGFMNGISMDNERFKLSITLNQHLTTLRTTHPSKAGSTLGAFKDDFIDFTREMPDGKQAQGNGLLAELYKAFNQSLPPEHAI